jgi:hypothetical protein
MYSEIAAKKIIEDIYQRRSGDGLPGLEDPRTNKAFQEMQIILHGSLEQLSVDLNSVNTHFVLELIQNAEDNEYFSDVIPFIKFSIDDENILIQNNELGFKEENIEAICSVKQSTKEKKYGYIGEKGIGFKSVFKVSDEPHIFSNGFRFKFNSKAGKNNLGFIVPYWIDVISKTINQDLTNILLPIREDAKESLTQFNDIDPNLILFLKKLKKIELHNKIKGSHLIISKSEKNGHVELKSSKGLCNYKIIRKTFDVPPTIQEDKRINVTKNEVVLAFPITKEGNPIIAKQNVFSYLPTNEYGFKFIIQADFLLTANREDITKNVTWNKWIRDNIHKVFLDSIDFFKTDETLKTAFYEYIPSIDDVHDDFFNPVVENVYSALKDYECILTVSDSWAKPCNVLRVPRKFKKLISNDDLKNLFGKEMISDKISLTTLPDELEIETFKQADFLKILKETDFIEKKDDLWLVSLYEYLSENRTDLNILKSLPLFKLKDGTFTSSENSAIFLYLNKEGEKYGFEEDLMSSIGILDSNLFKLIEQNNSVLDLFSDLGIKTPNPYEIIENYILPIYKDDTWKSKSIEVLHGYIKYIKENFQIYKELKVSIVDLKNLLYIKIVQKDENFSYYAHPNETYLPNIYGTKYDLDTLFSGIKELNNNLVDSNYLQDDFKEYEALLTKHS